VWPCPICHDVVGKKKKKWGKAQIIAFFLKQVITY
jgi:hypothetical protein